MKTPPRPFPGPSFFLRARGRGRRWVETVAAGTVLAASAAAGDWGHLGAALSGTVLAGAAAVAAVLIVTAGERNRLTAAGAGIELGRAAAGRTALEGFFLGSFAPAAFPALVFFETGRRPAASGPRRDPAGTAGWALALGGWSAAAGWALGSALPLLLLLPAAVGGAAALKRREPAPESSRAVRTSLCAVSAVEALLVSAAASAALWFWLRSGGEGSSFPSAAAVVTAGSLAAAAGAAAGGGPALRNLAAAAAAWPLAGFAGAAGLGLSGLLFGFFLWAAGGIIYLAGGHRRKRVPPPVETADSKSRQPWV